MKKIILLSSLLALFAVLGADSALASTVTRSFDNATPAVGSAVAVSLTVDVTAPDTFYIIDEVLPVGWAVTTPGTGDTTQAGHIKWAVLSGAVSTVLNYSATVPGTALGVNTFSGEFAFDSNPVPVPILGATTLTVPAGLAIITVTPSPATITGLTQQFSAAALDQLGNPFTTTLTWTSSNPAVGTINASGLFTVVGTGNTVITATSGTVSGTADATVQAALNAINVTPVTVSLGIGQNVTFNAAGLDQFSAPMAVTPTWTSSNPLIGTIDAAGIFTALSAGTATITATSGTVSGTATVTVEAPVLTAINITPTTASLVIGQTRQFNAAGLDQFSAPMAVTPTWTSSNPLVGTISATGLFTAAGEGTTVITAASGEVSATANVTVGPLAVTTINVSPVNPTITGTSQLFTAAILDQLNNPITAAVTWTSSNLAVGTIDAAGLFTAVGAGNTVITAASGAASGTNNLTVQAVLTTINVTPATRSMLVGQSVIFTAVGSDQFNNPMATAVTWTSSNPLVGTIDAAGSFTALSLGTATITATSGTISGVATINVVTDAAPVITIIGDNPATVNLAGTYADAGATALDAVDGDLTASIVVTGLPIDVTAVGARTVTYTITDSIGNIAILSRTVNVVLPAGLDATLVLNTPNQWTLFSAPRSLSAIQINPDDITGSILTFDGASQQFVQVTNAASPELLNPLNAFYVMPNKITLVGFNFAAVGDPALVSKPLSNGWNLIGVNNGGLAENELSSIQSVTNAQSTAPLGGLRTLFIPQTYNSRKSLFADWLTNANIDLNANPIINLPDTNLSVYDGYWVNVSGSETFSKIK